MRRGIALICAGLLVVALAAAPAASAKKSKPVGGSLIIALPSGPDPTTRTGLATGLVKAGKGCAATRIIRFAFFNPDGTPVAAGQPTVVSAPNGSFIAALPSPDTIFAPGPAQDLRGPGRGRRGQDQEQGQEGQLQGDHRAPRARSPFPPRPKPSRPAT